MGEFSWAYISGGAGDGPDESIQFRKGSELSGTGNFTYDYATDLLSLTGSMEISGTLTANQYNINVVDKTVTNISASGDTKFGDTADDTHQFTGSVFVSSSLTVTGSASNSSTIIDGTHVSSSLNISGSAFYADGVLLGAAAISTYDDSGATRVITSVDATSVQGEANLTFDGNKLAATGQISASLGVTGSSLNTAETIIDSTHISSSLNISGSAFYGDGANLTNIPASAVGAAGSDRQIQFNDNDDLGASANLIVRSSGDVVVTGSLIITGSGQSLITLDTRDADSLKEIVFNKDGSPAAAIQINSNEHLFVENENAKDIILRTNNQNTIRVFGANQRVGIAKTGTSGNAVLDVNGSTTISGSFTVSGSSTIGLNGTHVATVGGQLTASQGITLGESSFIASDKNFVLGSSGESIIQHNSGIGKLIISGSSGAAGGLDIQGGSITLDFPAGTVASGTLAGEGSYLGLDSSNKMVLTSAAGGGGTPEGSNTQIQFNDAGSFGASSNFTFDDTAGAEELTLTGSMEVVSGSSTVFEIKTGDENDEKGAVRGRMLQTIVSQFDLTSGAQAATGRYVALNGAGGVSNTLDRSNALLTPFSGRLISITYYFPGGNQNPANGQPKWLLFVADVNELNGNTIDSAANATSFCTASSYPGQNHVGGVNVQTGEGTLGGTNTTGSWAFGTGSAVGLRFKSGDGTSAMVPGQAIVTSVWEFDQLDPYISGSGN
jgi:hypothetical protein